ncbi:MAG TPA: glycosyltransferase family 2 protein [Candidatus Limnocylindria bacterium]
MADLGTVAMIFPLFNEAHAIGRLVGRVPPEIAETIVVDDGSDDGGPELARAGGARVITQGRRRGVGAAIRTGIEAARAGGHGAVVILAANGKDDPMEATRLIDELRRGYDYVQGSRFLAEGGRSLNLPRGRDLMIRGYTWVFGVLTGFRGTDVTNGFRAYRLSLLDDPRIRIGQAWLDRYELEYYVHWKAITLGYRVVEVGVSKTYPKGGGNYSKIRRVRDWWSIVRPTLLLWLHLRS